MKIDDKMIAAFLVSMGLFSAFQAKQYVATLSSGDKRILISAVQASDGNVAACEGVRDPVETGTKDGK
jgi:hypothetical protein